MKIGFNARLLRTSELRGWSRYTINLLEALNQKGVEVFLYSDCPIHQSHLSRLKTGLFHERIAPPMKYFLWEEIWLPKQCKIDEIDVFHSPFHYGTPFFLKPCPIVLTLHDAIEQIYYRPTQSMWRRLHPTSLKVGRYEWMARSAADQVITVSNNSKKDLIETFKIDEDKIVVIPEAADPVFFNPIDLEQCEAVRKKYDIKNPYFFYVGGFEKRKNIPFLLESFKAAKISNVDLVMAGNPRFHEESIRSLIQSLGISNQVKLLGFVSDKDLPILYKDALAFVYPSEYEGFGLQLCEAMALGCPIIAANKSSLSEVAGKAGLLFNLDGYHELVNHLQSIAADERLRQRMSQASLERSKEFSWELVASNTIKVYKDLID